MMKLGQNFAREENKNERWKIFASELAKNIAEVDDIDRAYKETYVQLFIEEMNIIDEVFRNTYPIPYDAINDLTEGMSILFPSEFHELIKNAIFELSIDYSIKFKRSKQEHDEELKDIFLPGRFDHAIEVLKSLDGKLKPLISQDGFFIGGERNKSPLAAWYNACFKEGLIFKKPETVKVVNLLKKAFPGYSISVKSFGNNSSPNYARYSRMFSRLL